VFEYSIRDFFECQNVVEACWFGAFFTQFREAFECQKLRHTEFLMLESAFLCEYSIRDFLETQIHARCDEQILLG
jgi:hypothetical protein